MTTTLKPEGCEYDLLQQSQAVDNAIAVDATVTVAGIDRLNGVCE